MGYRDAGGIERGRRSDGLHYGCGNAAAGNRSLRARIRCGERPRRCGDVGPGEL